MRPTKAKTKEDWIRHLLSTVEEKDEIIEKQARQIATLIDMIPENESKEILDSSYPDGDDYWK